MSNLKLHKSYSRWVLPLLGLVALALALAGQSGQSRAEQLASHSSNTALVTQNEPGKPLVGPPAKLRVVDLRALPASSSTKGKSRPLPFLLPHGSIALPVGLTNSATNRNDSSSSSLSPRVAVSSVLSITEGFLGISETESACGCEPPDGDMAVGPNHIIVGVNTDFQVFSKSGAELTNVIDFNEFFGSCGLPDINASDPITVYDPVADRFTVGILRFAGDGKTDADSYVSLAVSQSGDPTTTWNQYCFQQPYGPLSQGSLYDFPHIGVGSDALFTTGNLYVPPNIVTNVSARVNAYDKAAMYSGAIIANQVYTDVTFNSDMSPADTIRPALFNVGLPVGPNYFVNVGSSQSPGGAPSHRVTLWRWTDPFGANNFIQAGGQDLSAYLQAVPMVQPPPGNPVPAEGFIDVRLLGAAWHNNTIYGAHTIGCMLGGSTTDCIQWFQLGDVSGTPTLLQEGIVSGAPTESRAYPNIAVDVNGNVRLAYAFSSNTDFIGIRHTGRTPDDPPGTMGEEAPVKPGEQVELGTIRWGDYAGAVTDPDGVTLWHFEEYSQLDEAWGTWTSAARFVQQQGTPTAIVTGTPPTATSTSTAGITPSSTSIPTSTSLPPTQTPGGPTATTVPATSTVAPSATSVASSTATQCPITFTDVPPDSTFYTWIRCLACRGIVSGYADGTFRPDNGITRGQVAKMVSNAAGFDEDPGPQIYEDVDGNNPFYQWINRLSRRGHMGGYPCGTVDAEPCLPPDNRPYFRPGNSATRGQLSKIVSNTAGLSGTPSGQYYTDVPIGHPFYVWIMRLTAAGAISGYPCGGPGEPCDSQNRPYFRPYNNVTRGQASKIVANTFYPNCKPPAQP
jgi:hypothetical protein